MSVTLQPPPPSQSILADAERQRRALIARLAGLRSDIRRRLFFDGLMRMLALAAGLCAASVVFDRLIRFDTSSRLALGGLALAAIAYGGWRWLVVPLRLRLDDLDQAELIERRHPGLRKRIVDVLELPQLLATPQFASSQLVGAAIAEHARALEKFDFHSLVDNRRKLRNLALIAAFVLAPQVCFALWPQATRVWLRRWAGGEDIRWPQQTYLALDGLGERDRLLTPRGEPLLLKLTAAPSFTRQGNGWQVAGRGQPLHVEGEQPPHSVIPDQVSLVYRFPGGTTKQAIFTYFQDADFRYELPPLVEPVEISVRGGDDWFGPVIVEPIDRPAVAQLELISRSPGASAPQTQVIGAGDEPLLFLNETRLDLQLIATEPLSRAEAIIKDAPPEALQRLDDRTFGLKWTMQEPRTFELRLVSAQSGLASKPYFLTIGLLHDREPRLTLRASGVGRRVTPQARLPLTIHAADDFGLASVGLELERTELVADKPQATLNAVPLDRFDQDSAAPLPQSVDLAPEFKLSEQSLVAGQSIRLRASAADRCALGAHIGNSRWIAFQIVTPEELFYEILMRQREQRAKFTAALAQARTQFETLEKLDQVDGVLPLLRVHQAIGRQVSQVATQLDATLREMTLNDLSNPAARQLLAENVIQPLRELHAGPFDALRARFDQLAARDAIDPPERDAALGVQREIVKSMERILAQMSQWESFVDVVNQLRQIIKLQTELKQNTEQARKTQTDRLFDE